MTVLQTPIPDGQLEDLRAGDVVYLTGKLVTCRDVAHRRIVQEGRSTPVNLKGNAIFHAGPIVRQGADGAYHMVSVGPTTSMRMEKYEAEFIRRTGVKLIVGKGGMGEDTALACREHRAVHALFPGGCAVMAADRVRQILSVNFIDAGMPEAMWELEVENFGPLIITIDTMGNNLFAENRERYTRRKVEAMEAILPGLGYIR